MFRDLKGASSYSHLFDHLNKQAQTGVSNFSFWKFHWLVEILTTWDEKKTTPAVSSKPVDASN